jgi:hypothetical protein
MSQVVFCSSFPGPSPAAEEEGFLLQVTLMNSSETRSKIKMTTTTYQDKK